MQKKQSYRKKMKNGGQKWRTRKNENGMIIVLMNKFWDNLYLYIIILREKMLNNLKPI